MILPIKMTNKLDTEKLRSIIGPDGVLSRAIRTFESREQQQNMLENVAEAYNESAISIIEAGTGTGKSFAYLIPAIASALRDKETTVISTATINLQEQLFQKDVPLLLKVIGADVKVEIVKGMNNYLCKRKLEDLQQETATFTIEELETLKVINPWSMKSNTGELSEAPGSPSNQLWDRMSADSYSCNHRQCPFFKECHFFKSRHKAKDARILIVNHHLLFSDLLRRFKEDNYDQSAILPPYKHIIIDEAHHIEDIATDFFGARTGRMMTLRLLSRLISDKKGVNSGKLMTLKEVIEKTLGKELPAKASSIMKKIQLDIVGTRQNLGILLNEAYLAIEEFVESAGSVPAYDGEQKIWLKEEHYQNPLWTDKVLPALTKYTQAANGFTHTLESLCGDIEKVKDKKLTEKTAGVRSEVLGLTTRLKEYTEVMIHFMEQPKNTNLVRWIEMRKNKRGGTNIDLIDACLDVSQLMVDHLFNKFDTIVLSSATLASNNTFDYFKDRVGIQVKKLEDRKVNEYIYHSPFDYKSQVVMAIPTDISEPSHPKFHDESCQMIWKAIEASDGNAFVLFTSYGALRKAYDELEDKLFRKGFLPLKQGDDQRHMLLDRFKRTDRSVLFGTHSFWEGVDVAGEALRLVIIVKLPFKVPSEPIVKARSESISLMGGNPFMDYSVPDAIVKFKQGFGRLIRHKNDRGCVVCLDNRLIKKPYGRLFINSLPDCRVIVDTSLNVQKAMQQFYP